VFWQALCHSRFSGSAQFAWLVGAFLVAGTELSETESTEQSAGRLEKPAARQSAALDNLGIYTYRPLYTSLYQHLLKRSLLYFQCPLIHNFTPSSPHFICTSPHHPQPSTTDTLSFPPPLPPPQRLGLCRSVGLAWNLRRCKHLVLFLVFFAIQTFFGSDSDGACHVNTS